MLGSGRSTVDFSDNKVQYLAEHESGILKHDPFAPRLYNKPKYLMHKINTDGQSEPNSITKIEDPDDQLKNIKQKNQTNNIKLSLNPMIPHLSGGNNTMPLSPTALKQQTPSLNMISEDIDYEDDEYKENKSMRATPQLNKERKKDQQVKPNIKVSQDPKDFKNDADEDSKKIKSIFNTQTLKALGQSESADDTEVLLDRGPRYNKEKELISYSIVGDPKKFIEFEQRGKNKGGYRSLNQVRKQSRMSSDDRKSSFMQTGTRKHSILSTNGQSSKVYGIQKKITGQQKEIVTKQAILWELEKMEQDILARQKSEDKRYNRTNFTLDKSRKSYGNLDISKKMGTTIKTDIKDEEILEQNFNNDSVNENGDENDNEDNLSSTQKAYGPYQFLQNLEKTRQERQLKKIDKQNNVWSSTALEIGKKTQRNQTDTLILKTGDQYREKRELQDLLMKTKTTQERVGDCYWETLLRQHPKSYNSHKQATGRSEYGFGIDHDVRTITDHQDMLIKTKFDSTNYEIIRKPYMLNTSINFNSQDTFESTFHHSNKSSAREGRSTHNNILSGVSFTPAGKRQVMNNTQQMNSKRQLNLTTASKSFNKSLPNISTLNQTTNINNEIYRESFQKKISLNENPQKKAFENIFKIELNDLMVTGESKLQREKESLLNDGSELGQTYLRYINDHDPSAEYDPYNNFMLKQIREREEENEKFQEQMSHKDDHQQSVQAYQNQSPIKQSSFVRLPSMTQNSFNQKQVSKLGSRQFSKQGSSTHKQ